MSSTSSTRTTVRPALPARARRSGLVLAGVLALVTSPASAERAAVPREVPASLGSAPTVLASAPVGLSLVASARAVPAIEEAPPVCPPGPPIRRVALADGSRKIALTFDDGPWKDDTRAVMDLLAEVGLEGKATFFQVGRNAKAYPELTREVVDRGYTLGSHTMSHRYVAATIADEVATSRDLLEQLSGVRPRYFRAPGLTRGAVIDDAMRRTGMCNVSTAFDLRDTLKPRPTAAQLTARFKASVQPGDIVLLHVEGGRGRAPSRAALREMLAWAMDQGEDGGRLEIVSLDELLASGRPLTTSR